MRGFSEECFHPQFRSCTTHGAMVLASKLDIYVSDIKKSHICKAYFGDLKVGL